MDFSITQDFPAGLDQLWATFSRPGYPEQKYRALGATAVRLVRFQVTDQAIEVELERDIPMKGYRMPPWVRALTGREQTIRHRTAWRRTSPAVIRAELDISPVGLPVRARGIGTLVETGKGKARMVLNWRVKASLPIMAERAEQLLADEVRRALEEDHAFTLQYLQDHRAGVRC